MGSFQLPAAIATPDDAPTDDELMASSPPGWHPTDLGAADWCMRKLAEATVMVQEAARQAGAWREQIDRWLQEETVAPSRTVGFMRDRLQVYALRERARTGKATLKLPSGHVATRHRQATVTHAGSTRVDQEAAAAWLQDHGRPDLIRTTVENSPNMAEVIKAVELLEVQTGWACEVVIQSPDEDLIVESMLVPGDVPRDAVEAWVEDRVGGGWEVTSVDVEPSLELMAHLGGQVVPWLTVVEEQDIAQEPTPTLDIPRRT